MIHSNYHTHTIFCDGNSEPEAYIKEALHEEFTSLGFSAHAPLPFENAWSLAEADLGSYCHTILKLKEKYKAVIEIYLSLEIDYIPKVSTDFAELKQQHALDYTIGAVHLVKNPAGDDYWFIDGPAKNYDLGLKSIFNNDIHWGVETYFAQLNEMIVTQKLDIVAHFDKIKMNNQHRHFKESDDWYKELLVKTIELIAQNPCIVEVNTRGIYTGKYDSLYPSNDVLKHCFELGIPVTISADAHRPTEINAYFEAAEKILKGIGYDSIKVLNHGKWVDWDI